MTMALTAVACACPMVANAASKSEVKIEKMTVDEVTGQPMWTYEEDTVYDFSPKLKKKSDTVYKLTIYEGTDVTLKVSVADGWSFEASSKDDFEVDYTNVDKEVEIGHMGYHISCTDKVTIDEIYRDEKGTVKITPVKYDSNWKVKEKGTPIKIKVTIKKDVAFLKELEKLLIAETPYKPDADLTEQQRWIIVTRWIGYNTISKGNGTAVNDYAAVKALNERTMKCAQRAVLTTLMCRALGVEAYADSDGAHADARIKIKDGSKKNDYTDWFNSIEGQFLKTVDDNLEFVDPYYESYEERMARYEDEQNAWENDWEDWEDEE